MRTPLPFFHDADARLAELAKPGMLCAFDFDGTLAPIVARPEDARVPAGIRQRMHQLADLAPIAVITGRSLGDVRQRLDFPVTYVIGNHGAEGLPGAANRDAERERACTAWANALRAALRDSSRFDPGIRLEDKRHSLSLHFRLARDRMRAAAALAELVNAVAPDARIVMGKCVMNLVPAGAPDKGVALQALMRKAGARTAFYAGDDVTDEDVFRMRDPYILGVRVGPDRHSAAEFFVDHRLQLFAVLDHLIGRLRQEARAAA